MDTSLTSTVDTTLSSYNDFASLGRLKGAAAQDPNQALRATAEQFEAHFIQQMLQVMRETIDKSELTTSNGLEMYEGMFDKEVALQMVKRGGIGLGCGSLRRLAAPRSLFENRSDDAGFLRLRRRRLDHRLCVYALFVRQRASPGNRQRPVRPRFR